MVYTFTRTGFTVPALTVSFTVLAVAWRTPRIKLFTQYLWRDEANRVNWQSGLRDKRGRPKQSLSYFDTPFAVDATRRRLWGQVRPGGRWTVRIEQKRGGTWRQIKSRRTDSRGYFTFRTRYRKGRRYQLRWNGEAGYPVRIYRRR